MGRALFVLVYKLLSMGYIQVSLIHRCPYFSGFDFTIIQVIAFILYYDNCMIFLRIKI